MKSAPLAILTLALAACAPHVVGAQTAPPPASKQMLALDAVRIEGKLYSPQALFIASRTPETFGRDAVVPHYLRLAPALRTLPYELPAEFGPTAQQPVPTALPRPRASGR